ncbi:MAG: hypothetical protein HY320_15705 [Armatimonadetes bacterium]|nr:hypothetical protein [Armatimonadota bacterium]
MPLEPADPHPGSEARLEKLAALRAELLDEIEAAERALAALRARIERLESDLRLGAAPTEEYQQLKGCALPRAEGRLMEAFHSLLKVEHKIQAARQNKICRT